MQLVDSHCHVNFEPLVADLDAVLDRARHEHVAYLLCVSVNLEDFPEVLSLARRHRHIFASVGVHPNERDGRDPDVAELVRLAADPRIVAIGETGLDYFRSKGELDWQRNRFRRHIEAAVQADKPLIIHSRDAPADTIRTLHEQGAADVGGVMHCFSEDWPTASAALDLGFYISFSGIVTFSSATTLQQVARKVPLDRILVETDCPYLAPVPHRGKVNEPAFVRHTAEYVAALRGIDPTEFAAATTENFFTLFRHAHRVDQRAG